MNKAAEMLAAWEKRQEEVQLMLRDGGMRAGIAAPEQFAGKSGVEIYTDMMNGLLPIPPICETLDFFLVEVEKGRVVFQGRPSIRHYNPMGSVHGGWFSALLDSSVGCAVHSSLPPGKSHTTLELKVNMVRALTDKVPLVRAEGKVIHVGGQIATAEGRLFGPDGRLYAHASTTCLVFAHRTAKH